MTKPLPNVDEAFLMVQQQERRFNNGVIGLQLPRSGPKKFYPNNKKPICTYCGLTGHTSEKCYKKNGYPPVWKPRNRSIGAANQVQFTLAEQPCNESGGGVTLSQDEYRLFKQVLQRDNMTYNSPLEVPGGVAPQANLIAANFSPNSQLEAGTHSGLSSKCKTSWILDSGATYHIVCHFYMLTNAKRVQGMFVELPNADKADITHIGSVNTGSLVLQNVFCVPAFHYNLISVSELIKTSKCKLLLYSDVCIIQYQDYGRMIGLASLQRGLYHLVKPDMSGIDRIGHIEANACNSGSIWHARLGHCSYEKLKQLSLSNLTLKMNKTDDCDICHLAKQKRLPFNVSSRSSNDCFDLVHFDIWGPYHVHTIYGHKYFLTIVDDYSRATWVYLLRNKGGVRTLAKAFCAFTLT
nr:Integrase, catalytic core [Ipomoea batatas]